MPYNSVEQIVRIYLKLSKSFRLEALEHLRDRINLMTDETRRYEDAFEEIVDSIREKRCSFYSDNEIIPPEKAHALELLNRFSQVDVTHLRKV